MTWGKTAAWTAGVVGVAALGFVYGPSLMDRMDRNDRVDSDPVVSVAPAEEPKRAAKARPRAAKERPAEARSAETIARPPAIATPATDPELHARLKPVLNRGAKMELAAAGFESGEQFAMVAHAARNTKVPFMVLKHRVVDEGQTLAQAIAALKPELDAKHEAERARNAAHFDLEVSASN